MPGGVVVRWFNGHEAGAVWSDRTLPRAGTHQSPSHVCSLANRTCRGHRKIDANDPQQTFSHGGEAQFGALPFRHMSREPMMTLPQIARLAAVPTNRQTLTNLDTLFV
jgi:hypothetical protein